MGVKTVGSEQRIWETEDAAFGRACSSEFPSEPQEGEHSEPTQPAGKKPAVPGASTGWLGSRKCGRDTCSHQPVIQVWMRCLLLRIYGWEQAVLIQSLQRPSIDARIGF